MTMFDIIIPCKALHWAVQQYIWRRINKSRPPPSKRGIESARCPLSVRRIMMGRKNIPPTDHVAYQANILHIIQHRYQLSLINRQKYIHEFFGGVPSWSKILSILWAACKHTPQKLSDAPIHQQLLDKSLFSIAIGWEWAMYCDERFWLLDLTHPEETNWSSVKVWLDISQTWLQKRRMLRFDWKYHNELHELVLLASFHCPCPTPLSTYSLCSTSF